jgi:hypothetical protein
MSTDQETTHAVRSWLEAGVTRLPDRILDTVLDQVPATPQRRAMWPAWRSKLMNSYLKLAMVAAGVLLVAVVGFQHLPNLAGPGSPTAAPTPALTPLPTQIPILPSSGVVRAGTYRMVDNPQILATVPEGWQSDFDGVDLHKHADETTRVGVDIFAGGLRVFTDACASEGKDQSIGPTVQDLITALRAQQNATVTEPVDVTIGGLPGKRVQISAPTGLDASQCHIGSLQIWERALGGAWLAGMTQTLVATIYLVDSPTGRLAIYPYAGANASAADIAERDAMLASIRFE